MLANAYLPFFRRLEADPLVIAAIAALLDAIDNGHVCLSLATLASSLNTPAVSLRPILAQSVLVGQAGEFTPFILDQQRLYLARFWFEETRVAALLIARMQQIDVNAALANAALEALFATERIMPDQQKMAVALAMTQRLLVISGGPGTGKTTTLTKLLVAILVLATEPLVIKLAAPTGKAAARMQAAVAQAKLQLPEPFRALLPLIPDNATTLHRLLRINPLQTQQKITPLQLDVLVVDESSMVDLPMMSILLRSLPPSARLILLGDQDQLASVEPGAVFASLCTGHGYSAQCKTQLERLTGLPLPETIPTSYLSDAVVHLTHSYRFAAHGGIGALAHAIRQGAPQAVLQLLRADDDEVTWLQDKTAAYTLMVEGYRAYFDAVNDATVPLATIFTLWEQFRILTPLREGPDGSIALNHKIGQALSGGEPYRQGWYTGRAVMITENSSGTGLYNGDIGIAREVAGEMRVYFIDPMKNIRCFSPSRLPQHETAFVMTVHKSQGSEFDKVVCYLPDIPVAVMTRALFYTAVTRARTHVVVYGHEQTIHHVVTQLLPRESGLADRLQLAK